MIDELGGRLWNAHHEAFGQWVGETIGRLRSALPRLAAWDGTLSHLGALVMSIAITAIISFNAAS